MGDDDIQPVLVEHGESPLGKSLCEDRGTMVVDGAHPDLDSLLPEQKKKKKKKTKSAAKRGLGKPTGMEEFFADAPMTPEEAAEIEKLYSKDVSFLDRLLTAIRRFERTRKLTPERRDVFYKWLQYGSITVGQNQFAGGHDQRDMDREQLSEALSQVQILDEVREDLETTQSTNPKYVVDFKGCTRAFLSYYALNAFGMETRELVAMVTSTIERFMDYLLQQNVSPEYANDILATRNFCREAIDELWSCKQAQLWLPGDFNIACSTLFGGNYAENYTGEKEEWNRQQDENVFVGLTQEKASQIFGFAMAGAASDDDYNRYQELTQDGAGLQIVRTIRGKGFEVIDLEAATADCKDLYKANSKDFRPVGRVTAKPWVNPYAGPEDLTEEDKLEREYEKKEDREIYTFLVEEVIMQNLSVGQKVLATVKQLNCGIWFFDEFTQIIPDFEIYILNDLMLGYKMPKATTGVEEWATNED